MAGRGPTPKDESKRQRQNATVPMTDLTTGPVEAPELPGADDMLEQTRAWYAVWTGSIQAGQFIATDWQRLHMTAVLVDDFYRTDSPSVRKQLLAEIRLNEQKLGGTPEDRLRLRWRWRDMPEAEAAELPADQGKPSRTRKDPRLSVIEGGG